MMTDIFDWLRDCQQHDYNLSTKHGHKRPNPDYQQLLTPELSSASIDSGDREITTPRRKRQKRNEANDLSDPDRTRLAAPLLPSDSHSITSSDASTTSRQSSPSKRMLQLEISTYNPLSVVQMNKRDPRMPRPLKTMLVQLSTFQRGIEVVPKQLALDIQARQRSLEDNVVHAQPDSEDAEFDDFGPAVFCPDDDAPFWHPIKLDAIFEILSANQLCTNDLHPESSWNMLVHWPIFKLALGTVGTDIPVPPTTAPPRTTSVRASCVPCTTARITGQSRGSKMVDFCIALQPDSSDLTSIRELRRRTNGSTANHTDFYPLRDKPIVISAESKKLGEGLLEASVQVGVWQSAQWSLLNSQSQSVSKRSDGKGKGNTSDLPFLPALFIQGSQWSFAATTKQDDQTLLWSQQSIGTSDTALGMFQIIRTLRYLAEWSATVYWPWYELEILGGNG
ncbi:hypothetical protein GQX73_g8623 [Xylaria multiplex]|uniref:PD-(D/E)XK nuclease-like domain-containing protein n=1 Tax=Xylaria multiplex TaxID=323545 RepID=A0A7C8IM62_9PEZI|nr:hypothetical protein GQX73_g8623 [Xylaria multiplex]